MEGTKKSCTIEQALEVVKGMLESFSYTESYVAKPLVVKPKL